MELESRRLKFDVDKLFHANTRTQVLTARVCHQTQVASFLNILKNMFTNEIVSKIMLDGKYPLVGEGPSNT